MQSRRDFLTLSAAAAAMPLTACGGGDMQDYDEAAARLRAALSENPEMKGLIRFATLAANGHNTQPWRFSVRESGVSILPDFSRHTPVVDPDDHHLFVSLGCAAENLLIAAAAHGRHGAVQFETNDRGRVEIDLASGALQPSPLFEAIAKRQSTRSEYDGRTVAGIDLKRLQEAAQIDGVSVIFITDQAKREAVLEYVIAGNSVQADDPAFVQELRDWIRFNPSEAIGTGDGLFTACSGNPTMPTWIGKPLFGLFFEKDAENEKYTKHLRSSAGVAVFIGDKEDKDHWIKVGRSFQHFALQATALDIRHAHINQPVESRQCAASSPGGSAQASLGLISSSVLATHRPCQCRCAGPSRQLLPRPLEGPKRFTRLQYQPLLRPAVRQLLLFPSLRFLQALPPLPSLARHRRRLRHHA